MIEKAEIIKNGNVNLNQDNDMERLYYWITHTPRPKAQTFFTAGLLRDIAKELEFRKLK